MNARYGIERQTVLFVQIREYKIFYKETRHEKKGATDTATVQDIPKWGKDQPLSLVCIY